MFKQNTFNQKDFFIIFTFYNLTVFFSFIFLICLNNKNISFITTLYNFLILNYDVMSYIIISEGSRALIESFSFLWWIPITVYFNFQITKKRLAYLGYSKWLSLFNFYPLALAILAIWDIKATMTDSSISITTFILGIILPIIKISFVLFLYLKKDNKDEK